MKKAILTIAMTAALAAGATDADLMVQGTGPTAYASNATTVRTSAFANIHTIESITLDSATTIGGGLFSNCRALRYVSLGSLVDVTRLSGAFSGCVALEHVHLPLVQFSPGTLPGFPWGAPVGSRVAFHFANITVDRTGTEVVE